MPRKSAKKVCRKSMPKEPKGKLGAIKSWCLPCKRVAWIEGNSTIIRRDLPNGRVVNIACGKCSSCGGKTCRILSNEKK